MPSRNAYQFRRTPLEEATPVYARTKQPLNWSGGSGSAGSVQKTLSCLGIVRQISRIAFGIEARF
jgi:hypothetical protein